MARLPSPGSDNGVWGDILNDFLSVSLDSAGALKASTVGDTQVSSISQSKVTNLTSSLAAKEATANKGTANGYASLDGGTKVPIAQIPTGSTSSTVSLGNHNHAITSLSDYDNTNAPASQQVVAWNGAKYAPTTVSNVTTSGYYPLSEYGFFAAPAPIEAFTAQSTMGQLFFSRILVPAGRAINVVATVVSGAGTVGAGGNNCFAIYDNSGNLVSNTPADNTLWTATGWRIGTFSTPIAAQTVDRMVYVTAFVIGYSATPSQIYNVVGNQAALYTGYNKPNHRRAFYASPGTLPASFDPTTYGTNSSYLPLYTLG